MRRNEGSTRCWGSWELEFDWDELRLSEEPADELLRRLGYTFVAPELLDADRDRPTEAVLTRRALAAVTRLNPWIHEDNARKAVRALTHIQAPGLIEANEIATRLLVHGASVEQDLGAGNRSQTVRFLDFSAPRSNELLFTRQFRIKGTQREVVIDLAVFINGVLLGVIECKSPTLRDPLADAIGQLQRYQEQDGDQRGLGAPRLFHTAQILVGTCGGSARCGTVGTPRRGYAEWKVPHPLTIDRLEALIGRSAQPQDVLLAGLFQPENLLDLVQNYLIFEVVDGSAVRKLARYPQFLATDLAMRRIAAETGPRRGGVIWHTHGSGRSATLVFLAVKLRRLARAENPTLLIVTDRRDLDRQLGETFKRCGLPDPIAVEAIYDRLDHNGNVARPGLRTLLAGSTGRTLLTTIQRFQTHANERHPVLNSASNIFVLVDETHHTQDNALAANIRQALPNACLLAFTGTPIEKTDRQTRRIFGPIIHGYGIEEAIADGATVPVFYERRCRADGEHESAGEAIAGSPQRIGRICEDLIAHFEQTIRPNGFKAQIMAGDRQLAALYKETLDRLGAPDSALIVSSAPGEQKRLIDDFKNPDHPLCILIVCDPLLTGLDAPVEQVLYLDAPLREHALLQAIACTNRPADNKDHGLVVDYWGVAEHLADALAHFSREDVAVALRPRADELPRLQARHRTAMRFFQQVDSKDPNACLRVLEPEDARAAFELAFRRFSQSLDILLPDPAAQDYLQDLKWLGKLRNLARARFRDERLDLSACRARVRQIIEDSLRSEGVEQHLLPVSILSRRFEDELARLGSDEARATEMEHAIRHECSVRATENPALYQALSRRLQQIADARRAGRIDAAGQLRQLQGIIREVRQVRQSAAVLGLDEHGFAFYELLGQRAIGGGLPLAAESETSPYGPPVLDASRRDLAIEILQILRELAVVDWASKEDVQRRMRQECKTLLKAHGWEKDRAQAMTIAIIDLARARLS